MSTISPKLAAFFADYEQVTQTPGSDRVSRLYAESFLFAGPDGARTLSRDELRKVAPKREGYFKTLGLTASRIVDLQEQALDERYSLVRAEWRMTFTSPDTDPRDVTLAATYLLSDTPDGPRIVLQIDHQDFVERVRELGLA